MARQIRGLAWLSPEESEARSPTFSWQWYYIEFTTVLCAARSP